MIPSRTLRIESGQTTKTIYVIGTELRVNLYRCAPSQCKFFSIKCNPTVQFRVEAGASAASVAMATPAGGSFLSPQLLTKNTVVFISMKLASELVNDSKLSVRFYGNKLDVLGNAVLHLTAVEISLDVDADRDGIVERNNPNKASWKWGPNGHGAILLVNCDCESTFRKELDSEDEEITRVSEYLLFKLFQKDYPLVLNKEQLAGEVPYVGGDSQQELFVEGIRFPDKDFDGLITINLSLLEPSGQGFPETPIYTDKVMFRVAPWIMTPNTLKPVEVFVCSTSDNYDFLKAIKSLVQSSGYKLKICHEYMNRGDRWMQDEIEFGYIDSPHQRIPVVLDSPRDRELEDFPYDVLLGPDFGYVTRYPVNERVSSLDSFGNLEVSPPVTVNGKKYPLGRIIIGVAFPTTAHGRNMTKVIQDFLWAQKVQEPIALYSDWLVVGHVDEFMTFVPAPDRKGFRLLLASPDAGYKLFRSLQVKGHGRAKLFQGKEEEISVDELMSNEEFRAENIYVQNCIDWNRDVLKKELGLDDEDIIDLPILFKVFPKKNKRAAAYYPDMVNMLVLGKNLGIPKPFGPQVQGTCVLEAEMRSLLEPLGLNCTFIDDFASYHKLLGEVHCGSNVHREPFEFQWWNLEQ
ncbi:hypothetical protein P4O66_001188 [Electrophorus voltai]|uniref:Protein-arginine deiminase n=1 Tax=Electrophorus voltai TaxID=2609070 RepID=A0AAD8ZCT5_9TELE|nr:hypothetical protein P4O66_001188 [Electrophorus voltai]